MGQVNAPLLALNRGEVSRQALARVDVDRLRLAAETQVNCVPTVLGSMSLRPGLAMIGGIVNDDRARMLPFVRGFDETALIEVTRNYVRVWIDDAILTRNSTGTQLQNSTFAASAGWSTTGTTSGCTAEHRRGRTHAHGHRARRARAGEADHRGAAAGPQCRARHPHCRDQGPGHRPHGLDRRRPRPDRPDRAGRGHPLARVHAGSRVGVPADREHRPAQARP